MKNNFLVWLIGSVLAILLVWSSAWAKTLSEGKAETSENAIKIISITPTNEKPLQVGDEVEIVVQVAYKNLNSPATISLTIQKGEMTGNLLDAVLGSEMEVVTDQKGIVTLKHKITVPDTKAIQVFTPLLIEGAKNTSTADMKIYKVVKKEAGEQK